MEKYQRILQFSIGPHSIHIQARRDPNRQWIPFPYKVTIEEFDAIVQYWAGGWRILVSQEELDKELPLEVPEDPAPLELTTHEFDNESSTDPEDIA